jgi:hypothetical protein
MRFTRWVKLPPVVPAEKAQLQALLQAQSRALWFMQFCIEKERKNVCGFVVVVAVGDVGPA